MNPTTQKYEIIPWEVAIEVPRAFADSEPRWEEITEAELRSTAKSKSGGVIIELDKITIDDSHPKNILVVAIYNVAIPLEP